jgi:hypothetical protein
VLRIKPMAPSPNLPCAAQVDRAGGSRPAGRRRLFLRQERMSASPTAPPRNSPRNAPSRASPSRRRACALPPPATTASRCIGSARFQARRSRMEGRPHRRHLLARRQFPRHHDAGKRPARLEARHQARLRSPPHAHDRLSRQGEIALLVRQGQVAGLVRRTGRDRLAVPGKDGPMGKAPLELGTRANIMAHCGQIPPGRRYPRHRLHRRHDPGGSLVDIADNKEALLRRPGKGAITLR